MSRIGGITSLLVALILLTSSGVRAEAGLTDPTLRLAVPARIASIATDGEWIAWIQEEGGVGDVHALYLDDGRHGPITIDGVNRASVDIDDGVIVWAEASPAWASSTRIAGKDMATGDKFVVADGDTIVYGPRISGRWVVWWSNRQLEGYSEQTLWALDIDTMAEPIVLISGLTRNPTAGRDLVPPLFSSYAISDDRVAWIERVDENRRPSRLVVRDMVTGETTIVSDNVNDFALDGQTLLYHTWPDDLIVVHDLASGTERQLATDGQIVGLDDGIALFKKGGPDEVALFYVYDLVRDTFAALPRLDGVAFGGGTIVWLHVWKADSNQPRVDMRSARVHEFMNGEQSRYFPETGHSLTTTFLDFWERNGGLAVFGYPMGPETAGIEWELTWHRTVQDLERQRFEYHPENRGTPYEVLLSLLGVEDAARRGLGMHPAFLLHPVDAMHNPNCDYFPETGHSLCHGFREYWHSYGLDLGDPGVSMRESIALFGYPISEESVDPDTGLVTQYFERAVFEWHPGVWPERYDVLLRRLGAERLNAWP